jgi:hypothetical protein
MIPRLHALQSAAIGVAWGLLVLLSACQMPTRTGPSVTSEPALVAKPEAPPKSAPATQPGTQLSRPAETDTQQAKERARKDRERQRKLARLERELEVARLNLAKTRLAAEQAEARHGESVARAEAELRLARERLRIFEEITAPQRIARAELNLRGSEDGHTEAREELEQLELLYREEEFADQTKEIVITRARRRLERSARELELQQAELEALRSTHLPLERFEREQEVWQKETALAQLQRERELSVLADRVALLNAEGEITRLENELADVREEMQEAEQPTASSGSGP